MMVWIAWHWLLDKSVGSEVLNFVTIESTAFWDVTPCSLVQVYRRFGVTYCLHLDIRKLSPDYTASHTVVDLSGNGALQLPRLLLVHESAVPKPHLPASMAYVTPHATLRTPLSPSPMQ
jgi:hypothetical protein